jgi:hypothetical protein
MSCAGLAIYEPPNDTDVDFYTIELRLGNGLNVMT